MDMEKSKNSFPVWQIARINLRHNFVWHLVLAIMLVLLTPVLFGTSDLDAQAAAIPLEMFVSLLGIVLLTPVFHPEQNQEIAEIVASKYVSNILVYIVWFPWCSLHLTFRQAVNWDIFICSP